MNTQAQTEPISITTFKEWCNDVARGYQASQSINTHSQSEVMKLLDMALEVSKWFRSKGFDAGQRATGAVNHNGFTFNVSKQGTTNRISFKVLGPGAPKVSKGVAETSREAYKSIKLDTLQREVVKAALDCGETYDRDLAERIGKGPNDVSARRNELELADFEYNGKMYRIEYHKQEASKHTNRRVQWWRVVEATAQPTLF